MQWGSNRICPQFGFCYYYRDFLSSFIMLKRFKINQQQGSKKQVKIGVLAML
jgi:hypothetical protein